MNELDVIIQNSPVILHQERYAYLAVVDLPPTEGHLMTCENPHDRTVVTTEEMVPSVPHTEFRGWFRLFEFAISVPFEAPGFLASIAKCVADAGLNILILSTFSRDYVLLREQDVEAGTSALRTAGFRVQVK